MLSTGADLIQLAQAAPWAGVGVLALIASAWVYRQGRRNVAAVEDRARSSANRQGERIGEVEQLAELLDLRRRQVEWELLDLGVELPYWPPDGPEQPRPRRRTANLPASSSCSRTPDRKSSGVDDDLADDELPTAYTSPPVPPLPEGVGARHRRTADA